MSRSRFSFSLAVGVAGGVGLFVAGAALAQAAGAAPAAPKVTEEQLEAEGKRERRDGYFHQRRVKPGDPTFDAARARLDAVRETRQRTAAKAQGTRIPWTNVGPAPTTNGQTPGTAPRIPSNVSGRISALAFGPGTVYVGGAQGGIWRTTDDGASWTPISEHLESLAIGAIAVDPSDPAVLYVGTGEGNDACDSYGGVGVFKSTDGGDTWSGPFGGAEFGLNRSVVSVVVDRTNSSNVLASSSSGVKGVSCSIGPTFPARGLFRSTDGGATWTKTTAGNNRASTILQDPNVGTTFWAALWFTGNGGGFDGGLVKSTDSGATWSHVDGVATGLPAAVAAWGRAWITAADGGAETILYLGTGQSGGTIRKSTDSGATWSAALAAGTGYCNPQCSYDMPIYVEPGNADVLYTGGAGASAVGVLPSSMMRSTDGGGTFTDLVRSTDMTTAMHADVHAIGTVPGEDNHVWVGNDGGVWRSEDRGTNWINLNDGLALTQFIRCDLDPTDPDRAYGGTQDNGTMGWTGADEWPHLDFGDGGYGLIDQGDPDNLVHTYFNASGQLIGVGFTTAGFTTTMGGYTGSFAPGNGIALADRVLFYAPIHLDHGATDTLYFGTHRLYRANAFFGAGGPFTALAAGQDLTGGSAAISAIATHSATPGVNSTTIFTGATSGQIFRSLDGGATAFTQVDSAGQFVSDIVVDHANPSLVYASLAGFSGAPGLHVRKSTNGGATWAASGSGLPDIPVNSLAIDALVPTRLWAGTDVGVYVSEDSAATWEPATLGMPAVAVFEIQVRPNGRILACTHGRGAFAADLADIPMFGDGFESGNTSEWASAAP